MWIAFPPAKRSLKDPPRTGILRFSPRTAALASPTHGSENLPFTDDPAEPANTYRCPLAFLHRFLFALHLFLAPLLPFAHFTIAVVPGPWDQPERTVGELSTGANRLILLFVVRTIELIGE